jgi:hypothetical protein
MTSENYLNQRREDQVSAETRSAFDDFLGPIVAGLGVIGLGYSLFKGKNRQEISDTYFKFLGMPGGINLSLDKAANVASQTPTSSTSGIRSIVDTVFNLRKDVQQLGPIDIIDDLRATVEILGNPKVDGTVTRDISKRVTEYINRRFTNSGNVSGFFNQGLQRLTVGNLLDNNSVWKNVINETQLDVLRRSRDLGIVSAGHVIDNNIFINSATNTVFDRRLRNLVTRVEKQGVDAAGRPILERVSKFDMFGQAAVIGSLFGTSRRVAVVGPRANSLASRIFIDGQVIRYSGSSGSVTPVIDSVNSRLRRTNDPLEVMQASREGRLTSNLPTRTGFFGNMLSFFERTVGVGPGYASRPSILHRLIIDPVRRARAIGSGQGVIVRHPFKDTGTTKVVDAIIGAEFPELVGKGKTIVPVPGGGNLEDLANIRSRSAMVIPDRLGVIFDTAEDLSVVRRSAWEELQDQAVQGKERILSSRHLVVPRRKGGYSVTGKIIAPPNSAINSVDSVPTGLTTVGYSTETTSYGFYTSTKGETAKNFAAYMLYRLNNLASESLLGIGFKPSHNILPNIGRLMALDLTYQAGLKAFEYADYLSEELTGISPTKTVASLYAGLRVGQQKLREMVGIQQGMEFLQTYFPGSVDSEGSFLARSIVAPLAVTNMLLGKTTIGRAFLGGLGAYAAIGGIEPGQSSEDLSAEYSGDKKVAVRKGAFWGLGYLGYFGGKVERYDYSWYHKLQSDYRTNSIYGSKDEYWKYHANVGGIPIPTPHNLFGLRNLANPYRLEDLNYNSRPYPQIDGMFSSFPIIGPMLGATIGQFYKPREYRSSEELPLVKGNLAPRGLTANTARLYGLPSAAATAIEAEDPATPTNVLMKQANIALEPLGVYKFAMEFFGLKLEPNIGTQLASSAMIEDRGRFLYDLGLGGGLGNTELLRRFMLSDYSSLYARSNLINNVANDMPTWLPGSRSSNGRDREYFMDFTRGDPFIKITDGESRLPGAGYESLNKLHSGTPGEYSPVDRFLILADIAPYSNAYKQYESQVLSMELDPEWKNKVDQAIQYRSEALGVDKRYKRYEEDIVALNMGTMAQSIYAPVRKAYDFLTHDILAEIPLVGSKLFPFRSPYEQYRKMHVEGAEFASWDKPWENIIRPAVYDAALEDPVTAAGKGAVIGLLARGPMKWFVPFTDVTSEHPRETIIRGAAAGAGLSLLRILNGYDQDMIPLHTRKEEDFIWYTDNLNYLRNKTFAAAGMGNLAEAEARKTIVGAKTPVEYRAALPNSSERRFFDYFMSEESESSRSQIMKGVPEYMGIGLNRFWNNTDVDQETDSMVSNFLNTQAVPDSSWLGWSPEVSNQAVRMRFIDHGVGGISDSIHRFGFYEGHQVDLKTRLNKFHNQDVTFVKPRMHSSAASFAEDQIKQITNKDFAKIKTVGTSGGYRYNADIRVNRDKESLEYLKGRY